MFGLGFQELLILLCLSGGLAAFIVVFLVIVRSSGARERVLLEENRRLREENERLREGP